MGASSSRQGCNHLRRGVPSIGGPAAARRAPRYCRKIRRGPWRTAQRRRPSARKASPAKPRRFVGQKLQDQIGAARARSRTVRRPVRRVNPAFRAPIQPSPASGAEQCHGTLGNSVDARTRAMLPGSGDAADCSSGVLRPESGCRPVWHPPLKKARPRKSREVEPLCEQLEPRTGPGHRC